MGGKRRREEPEGGGEIKSKLQGVCFTLFLHRATALRGTAASVHLLTITATDLKRREQENRAVNVTSQRDFLKPVRSLSR